MYKANLPIRADGHQASKLMGPYTIRADKQASIKVSTIGWDNMRRGLNCAFNKLFDLKTFSKTIYLKF